jgi:hypothetical protein
MKLSALVLTIVIGLGLTAPLEAKKQPRTPKVQPHSTSYKAPKRKTKPTKMKPMKFKKAKKSGSARRVKPTKARKSKAPRSV